MVRLDQSISWILPTDSGNKDQDASQTKAKDEPPFGSGFSASDPPANDHPPVQFSVPSGAWSTLRPHLSFFLPAHYTPSYRYPLIVWLHSSGFNENQIDQVMPFISVQNYVGVGIRGTRAMDSSGHRFDWNPSPAGLALTHEHLLDAVQEALERFSVHSDRVVLAGYRDGGTMALRMAMREPSRFAGAISLGGRMPQGGIRNLDALRERRLPMLWQWGVQGQSYCDDDLVADFRALMSMGGQVEVRQYPSDDEMDTVVLRDIDDWVMRRIVSGSSVADSDRWATSPTLYSQN